MVSPVNPLQNDVSEKAQSNSHEIYTVSPIVNLIDVTAPCLHPWGEVVVTEGLVFGQAHSTIGPVCHTQVSIHAPWTSPDSLAFCTHLLTCTAQTNVLTYTSK